MRHFVLFVVLLVVAGGAAQAQEADTTATDTTTVEAPVADTSATDTTTADGPQADTTGADTTAVDAAQADTSATDTTTADAPPADTTAADTVSVQRPTADTAAADQGDRPSTNTITYAEPDSVGADTTAQRPDTTATLSPEERAKQDARRAARSWLSLTDAGDFGASWDAADTTLQEAISRDAWIDQGLRARHRLDTLQSRRLLRLEFRDSTNQFSGGSPVVLLQYGSAFARDSTLEAVITTKRNAEWKVTGYRVMPASSDTTQIRPDTTLQRVPFP